MVSYANSIVIQAPVSEVFAYVHDFRTMPDWLPGLVEVRNVIGDGEGQQCEWSFSMVGIPLRGQAVIVESVPNERSTHQSIGMFDATWTSIVEPRQDGTQLSIEVEYTVPVPVLARLAERPTVCRMERDFAFALMNLKELIEDRLQALQRAERQSISG
jgi:uncharacterized membrane protein